MLIVDLCVQIAANVLWEAAYAEVLEGLHARPTVGSTGALFTEDEEKKLYYICGYLVSELVVKHLVKRRLKFENKIQPYVQAFDTFQLLRDDPGVPQELAGYTKVGLAVSWHVLPCPACCPQGLRVQVFMFFDHTQAIDRGGCSGAELTGSKDNRM
jgi:hypothetical protein